MVAGVCVRTCPDSTPPFPPPPTPTHTNPHAYRYVNCEGMAKQAVAAVRSGELKILPAFHEATWYRWLENIR